MARTQITNKNILDNDIGTQDIKNGTILKEDLNGDFYNDLKLHKIDNADITVPMGYMMIIPAGARITGELRILGEVKIC